MLGKPNSSDFLLKMIYRTRSARLIHTTPDRIAFVENTSNGLNILASVLDWKPGDRILLNCMEFPSNVFPFMNLERKGVMIDIVDPVENTLPLDFIAGRTGPRTRLISVSHVQYLTGYNSDLIELGRFCRERGGIVSFSASDTDRLMRIFAERKIRAAVRNRYVRVAPHFYNTVDEIDLLIECIAESTDEHYLI